MEHLKLNGEEWIKQALSDVPKNATFRSKTIQNQIIDVIGEYITDKIVDEVKKSKIFSVLCDEASDVSNKEQMSMVLRYLDSTKKISERFVSFVHCEEGTSGEALAELVENNVQKIGILC